MSWLCNYCIPSKDTLQITESNLSNVSNRLSNNHQSGKHRSLSQIPNNILATSIIKTVKKTNLDNLYPKKDTFICVFCGGKKCHSENYLKHPNPAIPGLNSDLFFNSIYASQRPSNFLIKKFNLISFFKKNDIKLIVNLQVPGEHPICGFNTLDKSSGFSYSPSLFIAEGIKVKLCGWDDLEAPNHYETILSIVKEIAQVVNTENKKVFVHCHAGNGRTGLVIACYLIYDKGFNAQKAIDTVREKRKKAVEKKCQEIFCQNFENYLNDLRIIFTKNKRPLSEVIKNQIYLQFHPQMSYNSYILSSNSNEDNSFTDSSGLVNFNYVPRIIFVCLERVIFLFNKKSKNLTLSDIYQSMNGSVSVNEMTISAISIIVEHINRNDWSLLEESESLVIIFEILFMWLENSLEYCINPSSIKSICEQSMIDKNIRFHNQVNQTIGNVLDNFKAESDSKLTEAIDFIVMTLSKTEYETLKFISQFIYKIYPLETASANVINEFKLSFEKLSIFLLGYDLSMFSDDKKNEMEKLNVERLISLIEFFMFYKKNEAKSNGLIDTSKIIPEIEDEAEEKKQYEYYLELKKKYEKTEKSEKTENSSKKAEDLFFTKKQFSNLKRNSVISLNNNGIGTPNKKKEVSVSFSKVDKYYCS